MIGELLAQHIATEFPHYFTLQQKTAAEKIGNFLADPRTDCGFILKGYAGTGKTSLVAAVVRVWKKLQHPVVLLAPTGRAAKILSSHAGMPAHTIHRAIYRQRTFNGEETRFDRGWNTQKEALFIVDEASMIAANSGGNTLFGSGRLLDDLLQFVYAGTRCKLMFVGDTAQLPPVGEEKSPALQKERLEAYGLRIDEFELTEVVRQKRTSLVLKNATQLRNLISGLQKGVDTFADITKQKETKDIPNSRPCIQIDEHAEVHIVPGGELVDALEESYYNWGADETTIITRSNQRANIYNNGIRARIMEREELLEKGDHVMIVKNNYFWTEQAEQTRDENEQLSMPFIANGDHAEIRRLHNVHQMHGFTFADATLRFSDYDNCEIECRLLLDTLQSKSPALTNEEAEQLFQAVIADYSDIASRRERMKAVRKDPYYNALQIKYAYAVTCHKAQGGQWHEVYIDQGFIPEDTDPISYLRWLYTAFTRTSGNLYLVNWPTSQIHNSDDCYSD